MTRFIFDLLDVFLFCTDVLVTLTHEELLDVRLVVTFTVLTLCRPVAGVCLCRGPAALEAGRLRG